VRHVNAAGHSVKPSVKPYHLLLKILKLLLQIIYLLLQIITLITLPMFAPFQQGQPHQRP